MKDGKDEAVSPKSSPEEAKLVVEEVSSLMSFLLLIYIIYLIFSLFKWTTIIIIFIVIFSCCDDFNLIFLHAEIPF